MTDKPSVGRVVHYRSYGTPNGEYKPECRAAVITEVDEDPPTDAPAWVGLAVLNPEGIFLKRDVPHGTTGGTWHWPERIE